LKLRLRSDNAADGTSPASNEPTTPEDQLPASPLAPASLTSPVDPSELIAAPPSKAALASIKLKPRIAIKPSEPEGAGESIVVPELPLVLPPISSNAPAPLGAAGEKVKIDLRPLARSLESGLPAGAISPGRPAGGEKAEASGKFRLKPMLHGTAPKPAALPGVAEINLSEVSVTRPAAASPSPAGGPATKPMPTPRLKETPARSKPNRGALLGVLVGLLVLCFAGYLWFSARAPKPIAAAHSPSLAARPRPPSADKTVPPDHVAAATERPAAVGGSSANPAAGVPAETPGALVPASASELPSANPPPPVPTLLFRTFVDRLKISGVRTGPPARLFVDGVAYHPGDIVDRALGLVFVGVDDATSEIIFKDATGAVVRRRF
jgi:hypothetical protein